MVKKHRILPKLTLVIEQSNGHEKWILKIKGRKPSKQKLLLAVDITLGQPWVH